jgi:squalene synthase HpnC
MVKASPIRTDSQRDRHLVELERAENFPVALRLLPRTLRGHLQAVYDVVRVIDDTGDEADGNRTAALIQLRDQLNTVWSDHPPTSGVLGRLVPTARACTLDADPFHRLIEANLQDQSVQRYPTRPELIGYCALSADPIGRLVLAVFDATTPRTVALSDQICTALQVLEHCQDVGEDYRRGRIYLPLEDLARFEVAEPDFDAPRTSAAVRDLIEYQVQATEVMLAEGRPLIGLLHGWARLAVTGYLAGGLATADALRRSGWQVLPAGPRPRRRDVARHAVRLLVGARSRPGRQS